MEVVAMRILNVHRRYLPAGAEQAGALLDGLAGPGDRLWPADRWPPLRLDRPLAVGATGGHGPVPYHVQEYLPGRRVVLRFSPGFGVQGTHRLEVHRGQGLVELCYLLEGHSHGPMVLAWPLVWQPLHDALADDLLDRAELVLTGAVARPARWSPWVRLLRRALAARARRHPQVTRRHPTVPASTMRDA
jgi:hypothetical protein